MVECSDWPIGLFLVEVSFVDQMKNGAGPANAFIYMDSLRAVAAGLVVLHHARDLFIVDFGPGHGFWAKLFYFGSGLGHASVITFFVLSGFWIARTTIERSPRPDFWRSYLVDRLSRLWVVLIPALLVGAVLDLIGMRFFDPSVYRGLTGAHSVITNVETSLDIKTFLANLVFLQSLLYPAFGSNGPLWSLAYEFWYYLWFPALWILLVHRRLSLALPCLALGVFYDELLLGFVSWLCGALTFVIVNRSTERLRLKPSGKFALLAATGGAYLVTLAISRAMNQLWTDVIVASAFSCFVYALCRLDVPPLPGIAAVARYGARSSFSLYATHYPIVILLSAILVKDQRLPLTGYSLGCVLAAVMVAIAFGHLFSVCTERHTATLRRLFKGNPRSEVGIGSKATLDS